MDLDDLKNNWKNYNIILEKHLVLDKDALIKRNLDKSQDKLFKPFAHEVTNIVIMLVTVLFVLFSCLDHINNLQFSVPGLVGVLLGALHIYFAIVKALKISKLNFQLPIIDIQKKVSQLTILILKLRKFEILMLPFFIITISPIVFWTIQKRDLYANWEFFVFSATFIVGFSLIGMRWINKHLYDDKIRQVQLFLAEIIKLGAKN